MTLWVTGYDLLLVLQREDLDGDKEKVAQIKAALKDPALWNPFGSRTFISCDLTHYFSPF